MPYSLKFDSSICYKASQCTDLIDCEYALKTLENYLESCNYLCLCPPRAYYQRKISIEKKYKKIFEKLYKK